MIKEGVGSERLRLAYLDGLRGIAALCVMLSHSAGDCRTLLIQDGTSHFAKLFRIAISPFALGYGGVAFFIVLSGYCLTLPLIREAATPRTLDLKHFAVRRARRIVPPYYAAIALCIALNLLIPAMRQVKDLNWAGSLPSFGIANIITHLLLVHNLVGHFAHTIDFPLWSVGTEWQIYFIFALILLPVWQRFGLWAALALSLLIAYIPDVFIGSFLHFDGSEMVLAFGLGMLAAYINFSTNQRANKVADSAVWPVLLAVSFPIICYLVAKSATGTPLTRSFGQFLNMVLAFSLILSCTRVVQTEGKGWAAWFLRLFESRFSRVLGSYSYSLYLIHAPILAIMFIGCRSLNLSVLEITGLVILIGTPLICGISYFFHLAFEKPFLVKHRERVLY